MDGKESYPLVVLPPQHGSLVPVSSGLVVDLHSPNDSDPDFRAFAAFLWGRFCKLATLFFLTLALLRRLRLQIIELRQQANFWRAQHQRAVQREADLKQRVHQLRGEIRELKRRLYGRRSETSSSSKPPANPNAPDPANHRTPRKRGQQRGSNGHCRRNHDHLDTTHEDRVLPNDQQTCPCCGAPFEEIPGTTDRNVLEIDVRAHRRRYHRQRYLRTCTCSGQPGGITAPPPDQRIAKHLIYISLWVMILQHKFEFFQPLYRIIAELRSHDLQLPAGTITGGLQKIEPLFQPLYKLLADYNRAVKHWHCDETRWRV